LGLRPIRKRAKLYAYNHRLIKGVVPCVHSSSYPILLLRF
jgi:hypothetical protein